MMRTRVRNILVGGGAICLLLAIGALAGFLGLFEHSVVSAAVDQPMTAAEITALAARGRYLARAADCAGCHTARGGAPWAGGYAFALPVGTLYATNISPDRETGIGTWSRADFHRAVRDGIGKGGRHLYPAMPYVSYRQLSEADVDAIYAFFMTRRPIHQANLPDSFLLTYLRQTMTFWNLVNLPNRSFADDPSKPPAWNRGHYLVDALGHCGECHTPRDITMGMIGNQYLQGALIEGVDAPAITPAALARLGFDKDSTARFMRAGLGPQGVMSFAMYDVVHNSTQYLTDSDAEAMATYLSGTLPVSPATVTASELQAGSAIGRGRQTYVTVCAACHGLDGEGIPHVAPAMRTNATLRLPTPRNLLIVITQGLPGHAFPGVEHMQTMPGFRALFSNEQIADLANYLRITWGGQTADVDSKLVTSLAGAGP